MAYTQKHLRNHVMELQKYLHGISYYNPQIPRIVPDGIYDRETETAIRAFQREYHLPETGRTDMQTWNKLINVYKHYISGTAQKINIFPSPNHVVKAGDTGLIVYILQSMLNVIGEYYDNMPNAQISGTSLVTLFIIITVWSCLYKIGLFGKDTIFVLILILLIRFGCALKSKINSRNDCMYSDENGEEADADLTDAIIWSVNTLSDAAVDTVWNSIDRCMNNAADKSSYARINNNESLSTKKVDMNIYLAMQNYMLEQAEKENAELEKRRKSYIFDDDNAEMKSIAVNGTIMPQKKKEYAEMESVVINSKSNQLDNTNN